MHTALQRLARNRHRRMVSGRPVFDLTPEELQRSTYWAMRIAGA